MNLPFLDTQKTQLCSKEVKSCSVCSVFRHCMNRERGSLRNANDSAELAVGRVRPRDASGSESVRACACRLAECAGAVCADCLRRLLHGAAPGRHVAPLQWPCLLSSGDALSLCQCATAPLGPRPSLDVFTAWTPCIKSVLCGPSQSMLILCPFRSLLYARCHGVFGKIG